MGASRLTVAGELSALTAGTGGSCSGVDPNGDGHLGREEFELLWRQFWIGDDPAEPGNRLCGRLPGS